MTVLEGLKPEKVFYFFEKLCEIPHGSTNMKEISDYLVSFAKERNLKYYQDEAYNEQPLAVMTESLLPICWQFWMMIH